MEEAGNLRGGGDMGKRIQLKSTKPGGWAQWIEIASTQTFCCCDCNLYHQFQFEPRNFTFLGSGGYHVELWMRARRDNRRTTNARRKE